MYTKMYIQKCIYMVIYSDPLTTEGLRRYFVKKDKATTVRFNSEILSALKRGGWSVQKVFDWAVQQLLDVKSEVRAKKKKQ